MQTVNNNKTLLGAINDTAKAAVYGSAKITTKVVDVAVPAATCTIDTAGKMVFKVGQVSMRLAVAAENLSVQAQSATEVSKRIGIRNNFLTLKEADALPTGVETVEDYSLYLDEQLKH